MLPTVLPASLVPDFGYSIPAGYDAFVKVSTGNSRIGKPPDKFLLRLSNLGYQPVPFHVHGWHAVIVGKDTHPMIADMTNPAHMMNFTTLVGSGESYDLLFTADDKRPTYAGYVFCGQGGLPPLTQQVAQATAQSIATGTFIPPFPGATDLWANIVLAGGLGRGSFIPPYNWAVWNYGSVLAKNRSFPQFHIAHNHDDYKVTNNGAYPGGQLIVIETDFPGSDYVSDPPVLTELPAVCDL